MPQVAVDGRIVAETNRHVFEAGVAGDVEPNLQGPSARWVWEIEGGCLWGPWGQLGRFRSQRHSAVLVEGGVVTSIYPHGLWGQVNICGGSALRDAAAASCEALLLSTAAPSCIMLESAWAAPNSV